MGHATECEPGRGRLSVPTKRLLAFAGALVAALAVLVVFRDIFWPLLLALAIAYLLDPLVTRLERRRVPRALGVLITSLLFLAALALLLVFVVPAIGSQLHRLGERLPDYWATLERSVRPWLFRLQTELPAGAEDLPRAAIRAVQQHIPQITSSFGKIAGAVFGNLLDLVLTILSLVFVLVFTFYLLRDLPRIKGRAFELVPVPYRAVTQARLAEVDDVVAGFVRGQLTIAAINAAVNSIGLTLLGVPLGLVIGLAAGLGNLVPYMSVVIGLIPALLLSWIEGGGWAQILGVLGLFAGMQAIEDIILRPRILGRNVNLHPVWVLLAIIAGGNLFGVFGMILAVPVAGTIQVFARHWIAAYRASPLYWGPGEEAGGVIHVPPEATPPPETLPLGSAARAGERDRPAA
jgi:predicted PurR-regulated permease PerM